MWGLPIPPPPGTSLRTRQLLRSQPPAPPRASSARVRPTAPRLTAHAAANDVRCAWRALEASSVTRGKGSSKSSPHRRRRRPRPTAVLPRLLAGAHCAVFSVKMSKPPSSQDPYGWRGGGGLRASCSQDSTNSLSRRRRELPLPNTTTAALFFHARHHSNPTRRIFVVDGGSA